MSIWEAGTWLAVIILGPGALAIFIAFLRSVRKIMREMEKGGLVD